MQRQERDYRRWKQSNAPYLIAVALAFVMFMLIAPEVNEGKSMEPSINDGDVLVISKSSYSAKRDAPERDKIIIMEKTYAPDVYGDNIIARVAGLPGETVEIKNGKVLIDGKEYVTETGIKGAPNDMDKVKLKKNEIFLLCDNRDELIDSRNSKMGPVDMREIKGNVLVRLWPFSGIGGIK